MGADDFFRAERLLADGEAAVAADLLERMLDDRPEHVAGWRLYARALDAAGRAGAAADAARRAEAIEADHIAEVGASLLFHGDETRAETCFARALALDPDCLSAHWLLGELHGRRGARDKALAHYERCREIAPERNGPAYMIAALGADASPDAAPRDYVEAFFDWYADHFDSHLTGNLKYTGPEQVAARLAELRPGGVGRAVDLGCGTGLSGAALAGQARTLVGVDLSHEMLARARDRGIYEALVEDDLVAALAAMPEASADAIVSVDVLVYVGALEDLFAQVCRVLAPGGVFIASFEAASGDAGDWELAQSGRYRHSAAYIVRVGAEAGLADADVRPTTLREEYGAPVASLIASFTRPA